MSWLSWLQGISASAAASDGAALDVVALDVTALIMGLTGGLALFLFGMDQLATALKAVAGSRLRQLLSLLTTNRLTGVLTGAFVTAVIQSSSVTTVLVVGFISAGLMSMSQSVGVIMGANIGTTITAQIVAFKVTKFALPMVAAGFAMRFAGKKTGSLRHYGDCLMGLGLVFYGMTVMGSSMAPLRTYGPFIEWMVRLENPFYGVLFGALFTALVQSSSATTGIVITMASQGLISLPAGIALIFGSNIGTCVTAMLSSLGKPREALRAAVVHVLFNVLGVLVWIGFIDPLADFVMWFSPSADGLTGAKQLAADTPRQIANAHTIFNIANTVLFVGFATQFARAVQWLVPDRPLAEAEEVRAKYLDAQLLPTPSLALDAVRHEILRLGDQVKRMMGAILPAVFGGTEEALDEIRAMDDRVDGLHGHVIEYLGNISQQQLSTHETDELLALMGIANDLESIGDIIETNLVGLGCQRIEREVEISEQTQEVIRGFHSAVESALAATIAASVEQDEEAALTVMKMKPDITRMAEEAASHQAGRLVVDAPKRLQTYSLESDLLEHLRRIYYFSKRISRSVKALADD